ncbi:MAG: sialidase family protein [Rudaea sp.]
MPAPTDGGPGESSDDLHRQQVWMESMHNHAPGVDWRSMDAATRKNLTLLRTRQTAQIARGIRPAELSAVPVGVWHERGANNWGGRVSAVDYDPTADRLTVFAHGGELWRSTRANLNWQSLNDGRYFKSNFAMQNFVRLAAVGTTPERLIAADDTAHGFFYSDDGGAHWTASDTTNYPANWIETSYMIARDPGGSQVYALVADNTTVPYQVYLLASGDRGATWTNLGAQGGENTVALFAMGQGSGLVYLLNGSTFDRIEPGNSLTALTSISSAPTPGANDQIGLAGGLTTGTGTPFFYAFYEVHGATSATDKTDVFTSIDGATTWTAAAATVPAVSYIRVAAGTSSFNPLIACYGSVNLFCTHDGGATFAAVNDWSDYYANVGTKLHADLSFVKSYLISPGNEVFFIGTDGGIFESTDGMQTVKNDNPTGLRSGQYYGSYTGRSAPYYISIGAQDQGYQNSSAPSSGNATFAQVVSGDYASLTSSNDGGTLWLNYAGSTIVDGAPGSHPLNSVQLNFPSWDFVNDGHLDKNNMLFLPPLLAYPGNPNSALLSTATAGTTENFNITQLTWDGADTITAATGTNNFGSSVTAMATAGGTFFATANNGSGASFFTTANPMGAWTQTVTTLPQGYYLTGQAILPDPSTAGVIYVCGSGYSNPGVYVSIDSGTSFNPMNTGMPNTLVHSLAISPDGKNLFAATDVGPYYYDRSASSWTFIGTGAPANSYWNVEFLPALNAARFSTFGRGLWDYDMGGGDLIFREGFE